MRIGCLQFAPQVGDVDNNLNRADEILNRTNPEDLDLLVLPELAFSGYNFKTLRDIYPFLEPTGSGISSVWARTTALKYNCAVAVGYPETADVSHKWPTSPEYYNSLIMVNRDGDAWALYRKSHLYYTDESWALEGPDGFWKGYLPGVGKLALGICMDINPYRFEAPWDEFEFAAHALKVSANVVIISMAWLTHENPESFTNHPKEPDMETLTYWVKRMEPLIRCENEEEVIVIFANRCGIEDEVLYAGTSAVLGIQNGEVTVYGLLGRGENELLVVDTNGPALAKLVYRPEGETDVSIESAEQNRVDSDTISPSFARETTENTELDIYPGLDKASLDRVAESSRRAGGHVFIPPAMISPQMANFPDHIQDGSPISPRYFWNSHETNASIHHRVPSFGANSTYEQWRSLLGASNHSHTETTIDDYDSSDFGAEPSAEFSALVQGLSHAEATRDAAVSRPFSTKSRNASRGYQSRGPTQTSQYSTGVRTTSVSRDYKSFVPVDSDSRQGKTDRNRSTQRMRSTTPSRRRRAMTPDPEDPDLEKLDADLMVFERENAGRQKRDSLVCHVDDDDYIVLQTARKDGNSRQKKSLPTAPRTSRPASRQTPRQLDLGAHEINLRDTRGSKVDREPVYDVDGYEIRPHSTNRERHRSVKREILSPSKADKNPHSHRHIRSDVRSPSSRPSRRESGRESRSRSQHKSPPPVREHAPLTAAIKDDRYCKQDSRITTRESAASSEFQIMFSPDALNSSPRLYASSITDVETPETGITIPDTSFKSFPLTPKAMILEETSSEEARVTPSLDKAMDRMVLNCRREATEVHRGRPRSAVW